MSVHNAAKSCCIFMNMYHVHHMQNILIHISLCTCLRPHRRAVQRAERAVVFGDHSSHPAPKPQPQTRARSRLQQLTLAYLPRTTCVAKSNRPQVPLSLPAPPRCRRTYPPSPQVDPQLFLTL